MPIASISPLAYPDFRNVWIAGADAGSLLINAADEKAALMTQARVADTITKLHFQVRTVSTGADLLIRVESLDATGFPSGTLLAVGADAVVTVSAAGRFTATLTTPVSVTQGQFFAIVIAQPATSFGSCNINALTLLANHGFPRSALFTAAWAGVNNVHMSVTIEYGTAGIIPASSHPAYIADTSFTFNTGSTPDERGNVFVMPTRVRVIGVCWRSYTSTGDLLFKLYDAADVVLASLTLDPAFVVTGNNLPASVLFSASVVLEAGVAYRLTVQSTSASNIVVTASSFSDAADVGGLLGLNTVQATERTDAGAWTDQPTSLLWMGFVLDGIEQDTTVPAEADVRDGTMYGVGGVEFTGSLAGGGGGGRIIGICN